MSVVGEIWILVKFSTKREHILGNINDNIEGKDPETFKKLKKHLATRSIVRVECIKRVIVNYESLLQLWEECLKEKLDQETKARIVGFKSQMESFYFFFGIFFHAKTGTLSKLFIISKKGAKTNSGNLLKKIFINFFCYNFFLFFKKLRQSWTEILILVSIFKRLWTVLRAFRSQHFLRRPTMVSNIL